MTDTTTRTHRLRSHWPEALLGLVALLTNAWALGQNGLGNPYYAAATRSMTTSWHNFVFASYDPGGWITTDKPPLALWAQAVSANFFGLRSWAVLMPSAIAGAGAVWLLAAMVRRVWGRPAGLCAGAALALTPSMFAVSRSNNPDAILVFCMVAAAWAAGRSLDSENRSSWWMVGAGALLGLGFLAKMLVAVVVFPAIVAAYLAGSRAGIRRRLLHIGGSIAAFVVVAGLWVLMMDASSNAPFVGGSKDGSAWNLAFGYNGFGRVFGTGESGPGGRSGPGGPGGPFSGGRIDQFGGTAGLGRLFNNGMGDQVMWLVVPAAVALVAGLVWWWRHRRETPVPKEFASIVMLGAWSLTTYLVFAEAKGIYHNYYVSALAPGLAGLVGIGAGLVGRTGRTGRIVAAASLVATAVVQVLLIRRIDTYTWLRVLVPVLIGLVAVAVLVVSWRPTLNTVVMVAVSIAPAVWVWGGLHSMQSGNFPDARPANHRLVSDMGPGFGGGPGGAPGGPGGAALTSATLQSLQSQITTEQWVVAVDSSMTADQPIIDGYSVMSYGGFNGGDNSLTPARLAALVGRGDLRFVMVGGRGPGGGNPRLAAAVQKACTVVASGIYDCKGHVTELRAAAP